ncbi:MAG: DUF4232 domain-containing protein [Chloroflexia bacterium]
MSREMWYAQRMTRSGVRPARLRTRLAWWLSLAALVAALLAPGRAAARAAVPGAPPSPDGAPAVAWYTPDLSEQPSAPGGIVCFAETQQCVREPFLTYWWTHGQLAVNGYPLAGEQAEVLEDGQPYTVQYFERARLEYHALDAPPYQIQLGQFGRRLHPADSPVAAIPGAVYFPETGHNVARPAFFAYWEGNGGLAQFGYPLGEEFAERLEDGNVYRVQYFERARFEWHPEYANSPNEVLLGQFGRRILSEPGRTLVPRCEAGQLRGAILHEQGATYGQLVLSLSLVNATGDACWVRGYPTVQFADEQGRPISLPGQVGTMTLPEEWRSTVTLRHGEATAFAVVWSTYCGPRPQRVVGMVTLPGGGTVEAPEVDGEGIRPPSCQDDIPTPTLTPPGTLYPVENDETFAQANVVYRYAAAIDARDYVAAYALLGPDLQAQQSYADFVAGFATTRANASRLWGKHHRRHVMRLKAMQADGSVRHFEGTYEIGGVDGVLKIVAADVSEQP